MECQPAELLRLGTVVWLSRENSCSTVVSPKLRDSSEDRGVLRKGMEKRLPPICGRAQMRQLRHHAL